MKANKLIFNNKWEVSKLTILQAILISLYYWWKNNLYGYTFTGAMFWCPMTAALWVGIVLGDVPTAMVIGASLQSMYLGIIAPGANMPADPIVATLIATTVVIQTGAPTETAVSLAIPLGLLGALAWNINRAINTVWGRLADKYAEEANTRGIYLAGLVYPTLARIPTHIIPVTLAVYYGPAYIEKILNFIPANVMHGLEVIGGVMPAIGIAIVVSIIGRKSLLPYFLAGFFLAKYSGLDIMGLAIFGIIIAYLHVMFTSKSSGGEFNV